MTTALFFGSFNPPHRGHAAMVEYMLDRNLCGEVWLVVSPQNPFKEMVALADGRHRLEMARLATGGLERGDRVSVCDVEFSMPLPSYTIDTLDRLRRLYPERNFSMLAGSDILELLGQWKESRRILEELTVFVYPRAGAACDKYRGRVTLLEEAPPLGPSSTDVREAIVQGKEISPLLAPRVEAYIIDHNLWNYALLRGKRLLEEGKRHQALNSFQKVLAIDPANAEARGYVTLLRGIFEFRNMDIYNV